MQLRLKGNDPNSPIAIFSFGPLKPLNEIIVARTTEVAPRIEDCIIDPTFCKQEEKTNQGKMLQMNQYIMMSVTVHPMKDTMTTLASMAMKMLVVVTLVTIAIATMRLETNMMLTMETILASPPVMMTKITLMNTILVARHITVPSLVIMMIIY